MEYHGLKRNFIISFNNCDSQIIMDKTSISSYILEGAKNLKIGVIEDSFFLFNPSGITFCVILTNGELTIITNTTRNSSTINLQSTASTINYHEVFKYLSKIFKVSDYKITELLHSKAPATPILKRQRSSKITSNPIISILGSCGGVAKSVLSILNRACTDIHDPINTFINKCTLHLIDRSQKDKTYYEKHFPNLMDKITLYEFNLENIGSFKEHLKSTNTSIVIDISFADTVDTLRCCDELGVIYINSAFESISVDANENLEGFPLQERFKIFESHKDEFKNTTAIICSGMNPGVVQWMAIDLMKKYPNKTPKGCYIVEEDTSFFEKPDLAKEDTIYTTWSPECFLDEAIYSFPSFVKKHKSLFIYNSVYSLEFKVSLGEKKFYGCLMPHEESLTLGKMYDMETGFIYKINDHTTNLIKNNLDNVEILWTKPMSVLDPEVAPLVGDDLVGVLLVFEDKEAYVYNKLSNKDIFQKYKTNATYHQVASGLYGALSTILLDNIPRDIYYVDELLVKTKNNYGKYLSYHLGEVITGENNFSEGDLMDRIKNNF